MKNNVENMLFKRVQGGDDDAFELLFIKYYSELCTYALVFVKYEDIAKDIVHETFIRIWEKRYAILIESSFKAYIYRSIHNNCINYLIKSEYLREKSETIRQEVKRHYEIFINNLDSEVIDSLISAEFNSEFQKALESLPDQCREVFKLCRYEQLSYTEAAQRLDVSVNTIKTQMKRALAKLKVSLKHFLFIK